MNTNDPTSTEDEQRQPMTRTKRALIFIAAAFLMVVGLGLMTSQDWAAYAIGLAFVTGFFYACWAIFWFIFDMFVSEATKIAHREKTKLSETSARNRLQ